MAAGGTGTPSARSVRYGLLLPHFGSMASASLLRDVAQQAEGYGFDSLWVRDHLAYGPHGMEDPDPTFLEAFTTLAFVAASTRSIMLGTAAAIPFRPPVELAKLVATLSHLGERKIFLGLGAGFRDSEFAAAGIPSNLSQRANEILPETIEILKKVWRDGVVEHEGPRFTIPRVEVFPKPLVDPEIWYCGTSPLSLRIARQWGTGWVPGRITLDTLKLRLGEDGSGNGFAACVIPLVSLADSRKAASEAFDLPSLLSYANGHRWISQPPSGQFTSAEDLEGLLLFGTPDDVVEQASKYPAYGVTDVVFDLRQRPEAFQEHLTLLGSRVLPALRSAAVAA